MKTLNVNTEIKVKLTPEALSEYAIKTSKKPSELLDADGLVKMQLWYYFQTWPPYNGMKVPIVGNILYIDEKDLVEN